MTEKGAREFAGDAPLMATYIGFPGVLPSNSFNESSVYGSLFGGARFVAGGDMTEPPPDAIVDCFSVVVFDTGIGAGVEVERS